MKKTYISPDATVVNIDIEGICTTGSDKVMQVDTTSSTNKESDFASGSYRSSLWGE